MKLNYLYSIYKQNLYKSVVKVTHNRKSSVNAGLGGFSSIWRQQMFYGLQIEELAKVC